MNDLFIQNKLFDVFTRQALFIEQFKLSEVLLFNDVLSQIEEDFKKNLSKISYDNLGEMKKSQVQMFIKILRGSQTAIYIKYQRQLLERLQKFTAAAVKQTVLINGAYISNFESEPDEAESQDLIAATYKKKEDKSLYGLFFLLAGPAMAVKAWSVVKNAPMPTGGAMLLDYLNTALASNMMKTSQAVMSAWVNKQTKDELQNQVLGSKSTGEGNPNIPGGTKSSEITKARNTMKAVISTTVHHAGQIAVGAVNSAVFAGYRWVSVIDSRTSSICQYLNNRVFKFGEGPLPPAHTLCRSHTMPDTANADEFTQPDFLPWLIRQSKAFIVGTFKPDVAKKLLNGENAFTEENVANSVKPMTVDQFSSRTGDLF